MKIKTSNSFPTNLSESLHMIEALEERDKEKMVFVNALYKGGHKNLSAQLYEASCFDYLFFFFVKSLAIKKKKKGGETSGCHGCRRVPGLANVYVCRKTVRK